MPDDLTCGSSASEMMVAAIVMLPGAASLVARNERSIFRVLTGSLALSAVSRGSLALRLRRDAVGQLLTLVHCSQGSAVAWTADIRTVEISGPTPGNDPRSGDPRQWKVNTFPKCLISRPSRPFTSLLTLTIFWAPTSQVPGSNSLRDRPHRLDPDWWQARIGVYPLPFQREPTARPR
jgi:hypothetical protein